MVTIGSELKKVDGRLAVLNIGGDVWALAQTWEWDQGHRPLLEPVPGSVQQIVGVGAFDGGFETEALYTTDLPTTLQTIASNDLPKKTVTVTLTDQQTPTPTTKTLNYADVRFFRHGGSVRRDDMVRSRFRGIYPAPMTVT